MVKTILTLYLESKLVDKIKEDALKKRTKISYLVSNYLWKNYKEDDENLPELRKCEVCGTSNHPKFWVDDNCPNCESKKFKQEIINKQEKDTIDIAIEKKKELTKEIQFIQEQKELRRKRKELTKEMEIKYNDQIDKKTEEIKGLDEVIHAKTHQIEMEKRNK